MSEPAVPPDPYHRPHAIWECGLSCGSSCPLGPSRYGRCRSKEHACRPRLSLRGRRGLFAWTCFCLSLGIVLFLSWDAWNYQFESPGPLTSTHAQALQSVHDGRNCDACHNGQGDNLLLWLTSAKRNGEKVVAQSKQCVACHGPGFATRDFLSPHNLPADTLTALSAAAGQRKLSLEDQFRIRFDADQLACSTCHREHEGASGDLTAMSNRQCQACHTHFIHSFESGHPEFREKPSRRPNIAFDHATHLQKHFPGKQANFSCGRCHEDDADRNVKKLVDFRRACAECHTKPIEAAALDGLVVFSLPTLNVTRLAEAGFHIGSWPDAAQGDFDGTLSPVLLALLDASPATRDALAKLSPTADFSSIDERDIEQLAAVAAIAQALRQTLASLAAAPEERIRERLEVVAGQTISTEDWKPIGRSIPPALFREACRRWFPDLEIANVPTTENNVFHQDRRLQKPAPVKQPELPGITWWSQRDQQNEVPRSTSVRSANTSADTLLAVNPLTELLAKRQPEVPKLKDLRKSSEETIAIENRSEPAQQKAVASAMEGVMLAENPLRELLKRDAKSPAPEIAAPVADEPIKAQPDTTPAEPPESVETPESIVQPSLPSVAPAELVGTGAWFIDDATLSIRYRPLGHGDEFIRTFFDAVAAGSQREETSVHLPRAIAHDALKSCTSCHSISSSEMKLAVEWKASYRDPSRHAFTSFSHRPHLLQPQLHDCGHCHTFGPAANSLAHYETTDPTRKVHDFLPMQKSQCVACHNTNTAGGRCTQCHDYHVGLKKSG